MGSSRGLEN